MSKHFFYILKPLGEYQFICSIHLVNTTDKPPSHWFTMVTWFVSGIHQVNTIDELVFTWWIPFNTEYQFYYWEILWKFNVRPILIKENFFDYVYKG